jgi:hypothetical protein
MMGLDDAKPRNFIEIACGPVGMCVKIQSSLSFSPYQVDFSVDLVTINLDHADEKAFIFISMLFSSSRK